MISQTTARVLMPNGIKIETKKAISLDNFLRLLYENSDDVEDFLEVKNAMKKNNPKFYNFDDIVNEY